MKSLQIGNITHAAVGVIQRKDGLVLLAERPVGKPWAGYWEFPGGKIEEGETAEYAVKRELQEELGITVLSLYPWLTRSFDYAAKYDANGQLESPAKTVKLHFFIVAEWQGEPEGLEKQTLCWQSPESVTVAPMLPANAPIFTALSLAKIYAITYLQDLGEPLFFERLKIALDAGLGVIQVREKQLNLGALCEFIERIELLAKPYNAKVFVNSAMCDSDFKLIKSLDVAGVHLTSKDLMSLQQKPQGMLSGASCHNTSELAHAAALGLDYVVLSPVKTTLSHENSTPLGWDKFQAMLADYPLPVYALGGMKKADLHLARLHGAHGLAMQRDIWHE